MVEEWINFKSVKFEDMEKIKVDLECWMKVFEEKEVK